MNLPAPLCAALEKALGAWCDQDPEAAASLTRIEGRQVAVHLEGLELWFVMRVNQGRLQIRAQGQTPPDAVIHALPLALLRMTIAADGHAAASAREIRIEGEAETAERLWRTLQAVEFDWEEHLSRLLGDPLAHLLGEKLRAASAHAQRNLAHRTQDFGDYLTEEARLVPPRAELEVFFDAVDRLREDVDRLEARLARLEAAAREGSGRSRS